MDEKDKEFEEYKSKYTEEEWNDLHVLEAQHRNTGCECQLCKPPKDKNVKLEVKVKNNRLTSSCYEEE